MHNAIKFEEAFIKSILQIKRCCVTCPPQRRNGAKYCFLHTLRRLNADLNDKVTVINRKTRFLDGTFFKNSQMPKFYLYDLPDMNQIVVTFVILSFLPTKKRRNDL